MFYQSAPTGPQEFGPDFVKYFQEKDEKFYFHTHNDVILCVEVYTDYIIRFRYASEGYFLNDFSYAIDEKFSKKVEKKSCEELEDYYLIQTSELDIHVEKKSLRVVIKDKDGFIINEDEKGFHWEVLKNNGGTVPQLTKKSKQAEHYYGMGDKPTNLNLRGRRVHNWGTDEYGFAKHKDPIYKSIPFYIGLHKKKAYGIFFDNSFKSYFDFASERKTAMSFWAEGGEMNYYFINGPKLNSVVERYSELTGTPEMPPLWALGFHQCKWSYYPESNVKEICNKFREHEIPCDAIYLDIDYMDGYRCFTWSPEYFPDPKRMVSELMEQGFKTVVMIDPGIKVDKDYWICQEGLENDYFCKREDGHLMKGKVWPGDCYFPDFTRADVRAWWADLYKGLMQDVGVAGVWNDMNEPALFETDTKTFPLDVRHDYDGNPCSHKKAHNVYGMQMVRATQEGLEKWGYPKRPFAITRSCYAGTQRYSSGWTGDNIATWEHLWVANIQCQRMSVSGMSFIGTDIGGFTEHPSSELFIRWIQLAIFHPFFRVHSSGDHGDQEPWSFGKEAMQYVKSFIELRYKLLPYIYTVFYQHAKFGAPMLRPISFVDQEDPHTLYRQDEFMLGDSILACPVLEPNVKERPIYLPKGWWYNFWTDTPIKGGEESTVKATLEEPPIFIKPGAVLPFYPVMQYVGEKALEAVTLHVYYKNGKEESLVYEDAGDGHAYKEGDCVEKRFTVEGDGKGLMISQNKIGKFKPEYKVYEIVMHAMPFTVDPIKVDGKAINLDDVDILDHGRFSFEVPETFETIELSRM